jgi:Cu-Zn family superoxide dismutase
MPGRIHLALVTALGFGVACVGVAAAADTSPWSSPYEEPAQAIIRDVQGGQVGTLRIERTGLGTSKVTVNVRNLPVGYHGFHIHATGICDPQSRDPATASPFFSAGGHFDFGGHKHGVHTGDLPSLLVSADGTGYASFVTDRFRIAQLADADGSAIIVHALPDNFAHIPDRYSHPAEGSETKGPDQATRKTGDSGGRIACGVIR